MIKRHRITDLLYFCKTSVNDPVNYYGSGKYWKRHLKTHGDLVDTIWHKLFTDKDELIDFAMSFSEIFDIVEAKNFELKKIWANLEPENGIAGMPKGTKRGAEFQEKSKKNNSGNKNPSYGSIWITNGKENKKIKNQLIPKEWKRGRTFAESHDLSFRKRNKFGSNNPRHDFNKYCFENIQTKEKILISRYDFYTNYSVNRKGVEKLITGRIKTHKGWIYIP
jgi:hypothetical protein